VNEECGMTDKIKKCAFKKRPRGTKAPGTETNELITSSENEAESVSAEEQVIVVPRSNRHSAKVFDKIYYCPVCNVGVVHLPRHLQCVAKKVSPKVVCHFLSNHLEFLREILHINYLCIYT